MYAEHFDLHPRLHVLPKTQPVEQHPKKSGNISLLKQYKSEVHRPFLSRLETLWRRAIGSTEIEHLNLGRTFEDLLEMIAKGENTSEVLRKKLFSIALNIWSLRQEITGERSTIEVVTPVVKSGSDIRFWSDLHSIQDIEVMFEESLNRTHNGRPIVQSSHKPRQRRENKQLTHRWQEAIKILDVIDFAEDRNGLLTQMQTLGFNPIELPLTPSLLANIPSLREKYSSIDDLIQVVQQRETIKVWVGPAHHLTVSPPHWIHAHGKSSFAWNTRLFIHPDTKETWISEQGFFSYTPLESIVQVLTYGSQDELQFSSEEEVMTFVNTIHHFGQIPAQLLLDHIVTHLDGFTPAPKIGENVMEGVLNIRPFLEVTQNLFEFELERCLSEPEYLQGMYERLQFIAKKMIHLIALNDSSGLTEILGEYKKHYHSLQTAQKPRKAFFHLDTFSMSVNNGFSKSIPWDLLDCVFSPTGYMKLIPNSGFESMSQIELSNMLGERAKLWKDGVKCRLCNSVGWVGECAVCLNCEMKMSGQDTTFSPIPEIVDKGTTNRLESSRSFIQLFPPPSETMNLTQALQIGPKQSVGFQQLLAA